MKYVNVNTVYRKNILKKSTNFFYSKFQQHKMASICLETFGDILLKTPLDSHPVCFSLAFMCSNCVPIHDTKRFFGMVCTLPGSNKY